MNIFGIYVAPFAAYFVAAIIVFVPMRMWFDRIEIQKWVWHRSLFDTAAFVIILSVIGLLF
ncbi:MAG TPA: DUF1656 domain-containing protein [Candidatus Methylacidiphilales bacterium]|nr:DUF1656 domain-containing protein [Candidatus Methylacidiphilales bacterium]